MIETLVKKWDGETVIVHYDHPTGAWIFIAIYSTRLGPAVGGTRMKIYPNVQSALQDAFRLAEGMTYKFAGTGMPYGGGKAVIALPDDFDPQNRPALLKRYCKFIHQLGGLFLTGPDVGTSSADMDIIAENGTPYIFARTPSAGGAGSSGSYTALGVLSAMQTTCNYLFGDSSLKGKRILVQGAGSVGGSLIEYLRNADAEIIISELDKTTIQHLQKSGLQFIPAEAAYTTECDIFSPNALGGILNEDTIPQLKCHAVVGGANNQLASVEDAERLQSRDILYAPDYVVNAGAAIAIIGLETQSWTKQRAEKELDESIQHSLQLIFERAASEGITTESVARQIAKERLSGK